MLRKDRFTVKKARVYEDPISRKKLEGVAEVVQVLEKQSDPNYRTVKCRFPGDSEPVVYRTVHKDDLFDE